MGNLQQHISHNGFLEMLYPILPTVMLVKICFAVMTLLIGLKCLLSYLSTGTHPSPSLTPAKPHRRRHKDPFSA
jgi:hypothetical protein